MKKLLLVLMSLLPLMAGAKEKTDQKYLLGAVPEENGVIVFKKTFSVKDKTDVQIVETLREHMASLVEGGIKGARSRMMSDGKDDGNIVAKVEEYMVFTNRFLNLDRTRFRYQISTSVKNGKVELQLSQITYYYNENLDGEGGVSYKAESWISDSEAVNKAGTKLYPKSGKFRIKTVDRVEDIFNGVLDKFDTSIDTQTGKKKRSGIVEE